MTDVVARARAALEGVTEGAPLGGIRPGDAEFIASLRSLVPELIDEVEQLRERCEFLEQAGENDRKHLRAVADSENKKHIDALAEVERLRVLRDELCEAIRLTVEYVGTETLCPVEGWSWFDALTKYRPDMLVGLENPVNPEAVQQ